MSRKDAILKYVKRDGLGIEVGPWINPIAPKRDGFNCLAMDVFDTIQLRERAAADPSIASSVDAIEEVDLVGSSTEIERVVGSKLALRSFDYVVSSHNFEHLPNPIRFLQGCARVLKPGGIIAMAIPDHRACFDFFRPVTRLVEWLDSYHRTLDKPTLAQNFDHRHAFALYGGPAGAGSALREDDPSGWAGPTNLREAYKEWVERLDAPHNEYLDSHVSVFTPASFELLIWDCAYLGITPLKCLEIADCGCEFHAHLQVVDDLSIDPEAHLARRSELMRKVKDEEAESSLIHRSALAEVNLLKGKLMSMTSADRQATEEINRREARLAELGERLSQSQAVVDALRNSTSWRLTAPLRRLRDLMRGQLSSA